MPRWIELLLAAVVVLLVVTLLLPQLGAPAALYTILWILFGVLLVIAVVDGIRSGGRV